MRKELLSPVRGSQKQGKVVVTGGLYAKVGWLEPVRLEAAKSRAKQLLQADYMPK